MLKSLVLFARKCLPLFAGVALLVLPLTGCLPSNTSSSGSENPIVYKSDLDAFKTQVTNDVNGAIATEHERVTNALTQGENNASAINSLRSDLNTKVAPDLSGYIKKADLEQWLTDNGYKKASSGGSSSGGTTTGEYGELMDTDGDLELWLERVSPSSDQFRTDAGQNNNVAYFEFVVVNTGDTSHYFTLTLTISPDDDCRLFETTTDLSSPDLDWEVEGTFEAGTGPPHTGGLVVEDGDELDFKLADEEWIGADTNQGYYAELDMYQDEPYGSGDDVWWTYDWRIRQR